MKNLKLTRLNFLSLGLLLLSLVTHNALATVYYWNPEGTSTATTNNLTGTWNTTSSQWSAIPSQTNSAFVWPQSAAACFCAGSTTVAGSFAVTVNSSNIIIGGIYNGPLNPPGYNVVINGTGALILSNTVCAFATGGSDNDPTTINCILAGTGPIQSQDGGGLILNGANTFTGGFEIDGTGGISFGNNAAFGTGTITWQAGGFLQPATTSAYNIPNAMTHLAGVIETFSGNSGGVTFSGPWAIGSTTYVEFENIADAVTVAGAINGSANLTFTNKNGASWILTGTNLFTGTLTNGVGALTIGGNGTLGGGSYSKNFLNNGSFIYNSASNQTLSGIISGTGLINEEGSGKLTLSAANTYSGGTTATGGILSVNTIADSGTSAIGTSGAFGLAGGTLQYTGSGAASTSRQFNGTSSTTSTIDLPDGNLTLSGRVTGTAAFTVDKTSAGTLTLANTADNSFLGMNINGGRVILNTSSTSGVHGLGTATVVGSGATLQLGGAGGYDIFSGVALTVANGGVFDMDGQSLSAAGISSLTFVGTGISGNGSFINSAAATTSTLLTSGNITISTNTSFGGAGNLTIMSSITGTVPMLTKLGNGTVTFEATNSYSGPTTVSAGTLAFGPNSASGASDITIDSGATLACATNNFIELESITMDSGAMASFNATGGGSPSVGNFDCFTTITLTNNTMVINVSGSALGGGTYRLLSCNGTLSGTANPTPTFTGLGLAAGYAASITTTTGTGGEVDLVVLPQPVFTGLSSQTSTYGTSAIVLRGNLAAGTTYPANSELVSATINGHTINGTVIDTVGDFAITYNSTLATDSVSTYTVTYSYAGDSSLAAATDSSTHITVNPAPLTIAANSQMKSYGQTLASGTGNTNFTATGLQNGETIGSVTILFAFNAGASNAAPGNYNITPSSAIGGTFNINNYSPTYSVGLLTVNPATLLVTADSFSRAFGETNPIFTAEYTNFVNGETLATSDVRGAPALVTAATTNSDVGAYTITNTIGTLTSTNYMFNLVNGLLTVTNAFSTNVVTASTNPALPATPVVFTATLSAIAPSMAVPTNLVQFLIDGTNYGSAMYPSNGMASITNASLSHGYHTIEADYDSDTNALGETNIVGSTNTLSELINTPPVAGPATYGRPPNDALHISVSSLLTNAYDADGDTITLLSVSSTSTNGATIVDSNNIITYLPPATNANVTDVFTYTVEDSYGATNSSTVTITILSEDNGPSVNITGMTTLGDGTVQISFAGVPNYYYLIEATTNLSMPINWSILSTNQAGTNGLFQYTDLDATNYPMRYYRTAVPPGY